MPINRYQIRNVYSLADPELYKSSDKDDPEALLEGVAMAGLVGVLRQLGDLAEFAAEIFHDLHEEVMATAARGHGLLARVQQLESDFPSIERAFLSQTCHSKFFPNSGVDWHPNRQIAQNLITTGDLPRFVMDSYEECRGPPRLFLLDKFDVAGAGACLKRYTDPSIYKVESSSYETESAETHLDKKIRKTKKKGSQWKGEETQEGSQLSHAKLHQLFLEERVQNGASEPARLVKLKKRPNKLPFGLESGESYMNKLLNSPEDKLVHEVPVCSSSSTLPSETSSGSRLEIPEDSMVGPATGSAVQSSSVEKILEEEVDEKRIAVDEEVKTDGLQNGYISDSDDVASETDNYMDALGTMESQLDTDAELRSSKADSDANVVGQFQSQLSDSQSIGKSIASDDMNNLITTNTSTENTSPVGIDSPPRPFASTEIPFRPRVSSKQASVDENIMATQHSDHNITNDDTCIIDVSKVPTVNSAIDSALQADSNEVSSDHNETVNSPRKYEEHEEDDHSTGLVDSYCSSSHSVILHVDEQQPLDTSVAEYDIDDLDVKPTDTTTFSDDDVPVAEVAADNPGIYSKEQFKEIADDILNVSGSAEASEDETGSNNAKNELMIGAVTDANRSGGNDLSVYKDETELEEGEIESDKSEVKDVGSNPVSVPDDLDVNEEKDLSALEDDAELEMREEDSIKLEAEKKDVLLPIDADKNEDSVESPSLNSKILQDPNDSFLAEADQEVVLRGLCSPTGSNVAPCDPSNVQSLDNNASSSIVFTEASHGLESKSSDHGDHEKFEAAKSSLPEDNINQPNDQLHVQLLASEGSQMLPRLDSLAHVDHEKHFDTHSEPYPVNNATQEVNLSDQVKHESTPVFSGFGILPQLTPVKSEDVPALPPLPPMQWIMRKPQSALSTTPTDGGQRSDNPFPPIFPCKADESPQPNVAENLMPVETELPTTSGQELFGLSSNPYSFHHPVENEEVPNAIQPIKVQRPRTPLIDAVAAHDKSKLRKVSDRATPQVPKGEESDAILEQIRAKTFNLKPAVQMRPSIQGPKTNLRVAAILEKANAIRQAFAGSDDDDDDSDSWSD